MTYHQTCLLEFAIFMAIYAGALMTFKVIWPKLKREQQWRKINCG